MAYINYVHFSYSFLSGLVVIVVILPIISTIIGAKAGVELLAKLDEGQRPTTRPPLAIRGDKDAAADFTIIFNRAYVMLRDVPAQVLEREAHKTARNA